MFSLTSGKQIWAIDTTLFLKFLAMIAGAQFALPIIRGKAKGKLLLALLGTVFAGSFYGFSVQLIEGVLEPLGISVPQQLNVFHFIAALLLTFSWLAMMFTRAHKQTASPDWLLKIYVHSLNASQPHPSTITAHRNKYKF